MSNTCGSVVSRLIKASKNSFVVILSQSWCCHVSWDERCFWNSEEGAMSCWSWGPSTHTCHRTINANYWTNKFCEKSSAWKVEVDNRMIEILWISAQCLWSVARKAGLSVTEVQCPERRPPEPEPETGDSWAQLVTAAGATVRSWPYQGCLMSPADSRSQNKIPSPSPHHHITGLQGI